MTLESTPMSLEEFIQLRRRELAEKEGELRKKLAAVVDELVRLDKAAMAAGLPSKSLTKSQKVETKREPLKRVRIASGPTIKEAVLQTLQEAELGMTAADILPRVNRLLDVEYPRSSLSPQLSRLKQGGELILDGNIWMLPEQAKEKPADDETMAGPSAGLSNNLAQGREAGPGGGT